MADAQEVIESTSSELQFNNYGYVLDDLARVINTGLKKGEEKGIVIGVGDHTELWKEKGWSTLDIDPDSKADIIHDANYMEQVVLEGSQDYVLTEFLTFKNSTDEEGVYPARLLQQANHVLKPGGRLIIQTVHMHISQGPYSTMPDRDLLTIGAINNGFESITVSGPPKVLRNGDWQQETFHVLTKVRNGYKPLVTEVDIVPPKRNPLTSEINLRR